MIKRLMILLSLMLLFMGSAFAVDLQEAAGVGALYSALPDSAEDIMGDMTPANAGELGEGLEKILSSVAEEADGILQNGLALCLEILAVVMLSALFREFSGAGTAMVLASTLSIGMIAVGQLSGFFVRATETVDEMTTFSGFLFTTMATATAASGSVGKAGALYGITLAVCSGLTKLLEALLLPVISCYIALIIADNAMGDGRLKIASDTLKQLLTNGLKFSVIGFTAYLSLTGVISGNADSAAVKAAKLTISSAVPVVGSLISDASETLLVSAGLLRSSVGIFGLLGVLAVSILPFVETGVSYLLMKGTAAVTGILGEKQLAGLVGGLADALGLLTAVTGVCALVLMIGCVCFMGGLGG